MQLVGHLDWVTKLCFFRSFVEHKGFDWPRLTQEVHKSQRNIRAELFEMDVRFGDISEEGLFASSFRDAVPENKLVSDKAIEDALSMPPQGTRAKIRGESIERLSNSKDRMNMQCDWGFIREKNGAARSLVFDDPFGFGPVEWS